ncbi:MAG: hypothetical protein OEX02_17015, partial [Cyclobacteriaceae bacterium]|nr:hypothetical protein [Cyclobacteriaceae bacterium]
LLSLFKSNYPFLIKAQEWGGIVLKLSLAFMLIGLVPVLYHNVDLIKDWILQITGASTLTGVIMGYFQHQRQLANKPASSKFENLKIMASAGLTLFGLLLLSFHLSEYFFIDHGFELLLSDQVLTWHKIHILYLLILIILIVGLGFVTNLNHIGFHRMYRNRLMELFMADKGNIINNQWGKAESANSGELTNMCDKNKRPYHIINTNVVLDDSENAKYHNRGGDNFIMSPLYTGSEATGWRETEDFIRLKKSLSGDETQGLTLATAMAISGAAVNPSAGPNSSGITRSKLISILLGVLNLRLGYWAPNPNRIVSGSKANQRPDLFYPGLKGVLGISQTEKKKWIELTDGGHFENLALYELIRRRLKLIIVSDGGADEKFTFEDLANAMEKVRVDFNAKIEFLKDCAPLEDLVPKGLKKWAGKFNLAKRGYALGKITYPPKIGDSKNEYGLLVYIKTTLIDGLPADVYGYKMANPSFPDQTTGDQFFDEVQLEAYRELGYQLVKRLFNDEELKKKLKVKKSDQMTLDDLKRLV